MRNKKGILDIRRSILEQPHPTQPLKGGLQKRVIEALPSRGELGGVCAYKLIYQRFYST
jgi:hypothetical protein